MKFWSLVVNFSIIIFGIIWCKEEKILIFQVFQVLIVLFPEKSAIFQVFQVFWPKSAVFQVSRYLWQPWIIFLPGQSSEFLICLISLVNFRIKIKLKFAWCYILSFLIFKFSKIKLNKSRTLKKCSSQSKLRVFEI